LERSFLAHSTEVVIKNAVPTAYKTYTIGGVPVELRLEVLKYSTWA
jgi:hypothetical protein